MGELAVRKEITVTHTVKATFCFCFFSLTFAFLVFHDNAPRSKRFPFELWLSAAVSVCVQVIPVDTFTTGGTDLWSFILYTEVFGRPYYCYLEYVLVQFDNNEKNKSYKQMIVMLNLVLIDVICIVCFTVYGSTCVM